MTPQPDISDILAALTTCGDADAWRSAWRGHLPLLSPDGGGAILRPASWKATLHPWAVASTAEALEALHTRELWPWASGDERAPRWWCEECEGTGEIRGVAGGFAVVWWCSVCDPRGAEDARPGTLRDPSSPVGTAVAPPSLPALISVAALGVAALARAEAIVAETWPGRTLVWRVADAETLREHHERNSSPFDGDVDPLVRAFAEQREDAVTVLWPEECPYYSRRSPPTEAEARDVELVHRAWPALRAIAAVGLRLLACGDGYVMLCAEDLL